MHILGSDGFPSLDPFGIQGISVNCLEKPTDTVLRPVTGRGFCGQDFSRDRIVKKNTTSLDVSGRDFCQTLPVRTPLPATGSQPGATVAHSQTSLIAMNDHPSSGPLGADGHSLPIDPQSPPPPAFGCIVYLRNQNGQVHGRVANLAGIEAVAADQRAVLGELVRRFKQLVAQAIAAEETPDWIDPPEAKRDDERKLFLPVHL